MPNFGYVAPKFSLKAQGNFKRPGEYEAGLRAEGMAHSSYASAMNKFYMDIGEKEKEREARYGYLGDELTEKGRQFDVTEVFRRDELGEKGRQFDVTEDYRRDELDFRDEWHGAEMGMEGRRISEDARQADLDEGYRRSELGFRDEWHDAEMGMEGRRISEQGRQADQDEAYRRSELGERSQWHSEEMGVQKSQIAEDRRQHEREFGFREDELSALTDYRSGMLQVDRDRIAAQSATARAELEAGKQDWGDMPEDFARALIGRAGGEAGEALGKSAGGWLSGLFGDKKEEDGKDGDQLRRIQPVEDDSIWQDLGDIGMDLGKSWLKNIDFGAGSDWADALNLGSGLYDEGSQMLFGDAGIFDISDFGASLGGELSSGFGGYDAFADFGFMDELSSFWDFSQGSSSLVSGGGATSSIGGGATAAPTWEATSLFSEAELGSLLSGGGDTAAGAGVVAEGASFMDYFGAAGIGFSAGSMFGEDIGEFVGVEGDVGGGVGGTAAGAAAGALYGSVVPGPGTIIGAVVGGLAGALGGSNFMGMFGGADKPWFEFGKTGEHDYENARPFYADTTSASRWEENKGYTLNWNPASESYGGDVLKVAQAWEKGVGTMHDQYNTNLMREIASMPLASQDEAREILKSKPIETVFAGGSSYYKDTDIWFRGQMEANEALMQEHFGTVRSDWGKLLDIKDTTYTAPYKKEIQAREQKVVADAQAADQRKINALVVASKDRENPTRRNNAIRELRDLGLYTEPQRNIE